MNFNLRYPEYDTCQDLLQVTGNIKKYFQMKIPTMSHLTSLVQRSPWHGSVRWYKAPFLWLVVSQTHC